VVPNSKKGKHNSGLIHKIKLSVSDALGGLGEGRGVVMYSPPGPGTKQAVSEAVKLFLELCFIFYMFYFIVT
jgi:hypothetical protein